VSRVLQKLPTFNRQEILDELVKRIPKITGTVTYEVAPVEKLQKDFLEDAKNQILTLVRGLDEEQKKILKFCEAIGKGTILSEIMEKCLYVNATSGGSRQRVNEKLNAMSGLEVIRREADGKIYGNLKPKISKHLEMPLGKATTSHGGTGLGNRPGNQPPSRPPATRTSSDDPGVA